MGLFGGLSGFSSYGMSHAEKEAQRVMMQRMGRSSGARAGTARVAKAAGRSSGARAGGFFGALGKAFKAMGPMG